MQTHKNANLKQTGSTPQRAGAAVGSAGVQMDKPPQFAKDGKKWIIVGANVIVINFVFKT